MKKTYIIHPHGPPPERERVSCLNFHELPYRDRAKFFCEMGKEHYEYVYKMNENFRRDHERK